MPYPDKILADDEKVVEHLHPHWITLVPATLWFLVICGATGFGLAEIHQHMDSGTTRTVLMLVIVVVAIILLLWLTLVPVILWKTTHYVFTTHRVLIRRGVLRRQGRDISLQRINDVGFSQSLWDRLVGAGTLTIESAGEQGQEVLVNVPKSDDQQQLLNRLIEQDHDRRGRAYGGPVQMPQQPPPGYPPPQQPPYPPTQQYPQQ